MGLALSKLGRNFEAVDALDRALAMPGVFIANRKDIQDLLQKTKDRLPRLVVTVNVEGAEISVDGRAIGQSPLGAPVILAPGEHRVAVNKAGFRAAGAVVTLPDNERHETQLQLTLQTETFEPRPAPQPSPAGPSLVPRSPPIAPSPIAPSLQTESEAGGHKKWSRWRIAAVASTGVGVVGLATGSVFGLRARSFWSTAKMRCTDVPCNDVRGLSAQEDAGTNADRATVAFVAGGVAVAAGVVMWLIDR
jgi:hypothetical protein